MEYRPRRPDGMLIGWEEYLNLPSPLPMLRLRLERFPFGQQRWHLQWPGVYIGLLPEGVRVITGDYGRDIQEFKRKFGLGPFVITSAPYVIISGWRPPVFRGDFLAQIVIQPVPHGDTEFVYYDMLFKMAEQSMSGHVDLYFEHVRSMEGY